MENTRLYHRPKLTPPPHPVSFKFTGGRERAEKVPPCVRYIINTFFLPFSAKIKHSQGAFFFGDGAQSQPHGYSPQLTSVSSFIIPQLSAFVKSNPFLHNVFLRQKSIPSERCGADVKRAYLPVEICEANTTARLFTLAHGVSSAAELQPPRLRLLPPGGEPVIRV